MTTDSPVRSRGQEGQGNRPGEGPHPGPRVRWRGAGLASTLLLLVLALPLGARAQTTPCTVDSEAVTGGPNVTGLVADCTTLLGLKDTLRGTATLNWAENLAMTSWDGITVAGDPPRVTGLSLRDKALSGTIPPALGQLSALTSLYLDINDGLETNDNNLSGEIPKELGQLSNLTHLYLDNNNLIGEIPKELGQLTALTHLFLHDNALSGAIPAELGNMSKLQWLYLYNTNLIGEIPEELGNLKKLWHLTLHNNNLSGTIPSTLGNMSALLNLELHNNNLSGAIPAELGQLTQLQYLYLHNNKLSGPIPPELGDLDAKFFFELYLNNNNLSGEIPAALGNLSELKQLYLNNNNLSEEIPAALGNLSKLRRLHLHNNNLSGPLPAELGNMSALGHLSLHNNTLLEGPLPTSFVTLSALQELHVQNTQVSVPEDMAVQDWLADIIFTTGTQERSGTIPLAAANAAPWGLWSDGTTLWVADTAARKVFAYTLATRRRDAAKDIPLDAANTEPLGLWSDGTTLWVADFTDARLYAYTLASLSRDASSDIVLDAGNTAPLGLWGDETTLWVANDWLPTRTPKVYAYTDGTHDAPKDIDLQSVNSYPQGLWGDGTTLWVVDSDDARLYVYTLAGGSHDAAHYRILDPANAAPRGLTSVGTSDGTTLYVTDVADATVYIYMHERLRAVGTLPDQMLTLADVADAQTLTVTSAFRDPDGDALTYSAMSSDEAVAAVTVSGAEVSVRPVAVGMATITVTATDGSEMPVTQSFAVTVGDEQLPNQEPQAVGGLPAQMLAVGGGAQTLPVTSAFRDPDGDELTYTVTSSNTRIATARIVSQNAEEGASRATTRSSDTRIAAVQGAEVVEVSPVAGGTVTITVTATTDADGLNQTATQSFTVTVDGPPPPRPPRPPVTGGGSGGGGSGGGSTASRDAHGNSPAQATRITPGAMAPWASSTPGQINTEADIDYFTLTVPQAGVLVVETTGFTDTVGTVWQEGEELGMADSGGERRNFRLAVPVEAGPVVIAVAGNGSRTGAYTLRTQLVVGYLENPGRDSFQSGIGVLSGWVCAAGVVEIELNGVPQEAAYGTERLDTAGVCGNTDNGFGLLFNWNLLRDGEHEVVALVDGVELGRATVTVTTLGMEFVRDVTGTCEAEDFPMVGETVTLEWQQTSQNFVIAEGAAPAGVNRAGIAGVGYLENPGANSFQSGIGVISGWVCAADAVEIAIGDLALQGAGYGTERLDTEDVCGDTANGFGLLFNWNLLGEGEHAVVAYVDGEELGRATVRVTTVGEGAEEEFLRGAEGECVVEDFPMPGETVTVEWQQNSQNFVITAIE